MGKASRDIISGWSYVECCAGLRAALASVGLKASRNRESDLCN
jgi:hypothetical protein